MAFGRLLSRFRGILRGQNTGGPRKGQGATEYLVVLGAVLLVSIVVVSAMYSFPSSQASIKQQQSQAYWSSLSPIKVLSSKVVDSNLVLGLQNTGTFTIRLDGINVGGTDLPIYPYNAGDYYGAAYCSRPYDNFSAPSMTCALMLGPGESAYVAAQGAVSGVGNVIDCAGKTGVEISSVQFAYSLGGSGVTNLILKGDKPIVTSCGTKACDANWVKVPGNSSFLVNDFCMMKYEAKNVSGTATSQAVLVPWRSINHTYASSRCSALGSGYHLIRDREWNVVANNVANVASNWQNGVVGSGCLYGGHTDNDPSGVLAASTDDDPYSGTGNSAANSFSCPFTTGAGYGKEQRRTMSLSTGDAVWDLSGNVWEWTDGTIMSTACSSGTMPVPCTGWVEYSSVTNFMSASWSRLPVSSWNQNNGVGRLYSDPGTASDGGNVHAFTRGGYCAGGAWAGSFALYLHYAPSDSDGNVGFRCCK